MVGLASIKETRHITIVKFHLLNQNPHTVILTCVKNKVLSFEEIISILVEKA